MASATVRSRVMTTAVAHSHHSCRSARWNFERRTLVASVPGSSTFRVPCRPTNHPWASTFSRRPLCFRYRAWYSSWDADPSYVFLQEAYQGRLHSCSADSAQRIEIPEESPFSDYPATAGQNNPVPAGSSTSVSEHVVKGAFSGFCNSLRAASRTSKLFGQAHLHTQTRWREEPSKLWECRFHRRRTRI